MTFSDLVLTWYAKEGRCHLPWQQEPTGYRIWVSEIMLQQTRVDTVIEYFERFMTRFPTVRHLARAKSDEVLHLWSGLGYYARARNLHTTARIIHERYDDEFPTGFDEVRSLPGIGRSTAGAILSLAFGQRHAILDGNVKRVLTRHHAIAGWPGDATVTKALWALAEYHTPHCRVAEYTQAMMDLGATVCTRTRPLCPHCPVCATCRAYAEERQECFPTKRPQKILPVRATRFILVVRTENENPHNTKSHPPIRSVLLEKRPTTGVWGGLWSFPECALGNDLNAWCTTRFGNTPINIEPLPSFRHTFTHFHLDIHPILLSYGSTTGPSPDLHRFSRKRMIARFVKNTESSHNIDSDRTIWYPLEKSSIDKPPALGLATPVARLLDMLCCGTMQSFIQEQH
uniref:Adenine DNA glycosylase n=1 Tax=Candidatus Kentrum sp. TUN TaxID=2126343 RepID=A0A450ZIA0_9GAMM|nr:MAG: A/G-specific DNA-adenine glycosylase [Candidatus Kentron sp. TUN]VFK54660.1 MAG: A/G-specific DNA-adenine glycosylase [Candidatus Kentron sp. TUN]